MHQAMNRTLAFPELHSEEVHEIISRPPHWLVRWGITLFFCMLILIGAGTWWIRYPDIVTVSFTLSAMDAPRSVVVRSEGKLNRLMVEDGQQVNRGQAIAYCESTADHEQVLSLSKSVQKNLHALEQNRWEAVQHFGSQSYANLGELQNDFQTFHRQLTELKAFLSGGFYLEKRKLLTDDYNDLREMEKVLGQQLTLQHSDFDLATDEFKIQDKLHNDKVIASLEYKREKAKLLSREMPLKNLASSLIQNRTSQTAKQKEILELDNSIAEHKSSFLQALQTLQSSIENWKQKYILSAPVAGKISFFAPWQEQQHLTVGQELMTVEPTGSSFQGLIKIPQANLGKLHEGQTVLIKLDGYPYREYGMVEGTLSQLSMTPGQDSAYWGYVALPQKLQTRYGRAIPYRNGLKGAAEIITADRRLAERLITTVRNGGR
jgi:multidrug efflux pump subunit AcrA (membrane-fusion protein)